VLSGIQLLNLYRIVQEFIQNTIKYADATNVSISFSNENSKIILKLSDNGKGFDISSIHFGNGILNMKRRCEDLYGDFEIHSESEGTKICCRIPVNKKGNPSVDGPLFQKILN
jgi:signal transduction histidine kinase